MVIDKLISSNHSTFLKNRQIVAGVVVINGVIDEAKRWGL